MTTLRLYNTLTRTKEDFAPIDPNNVRMYVCGPTVYDYAHIGNARPAIVFDVLYRLLRHLYPGAGKAADGSRVTYVRNITDIDDKINARALERRGDRNVPILDVVRELTEQTYGVYRDDVTALGCLPPTYMPRATENIAPMIAMTQTLIDNGHAYEASGHVLFDVSSKADYGKLSRRSTDDMIAGARVDVAPYKKSPMDFVLWKPSDANTPGWDSPWGRGRPGWHLECSAMIQSTFAGTDTIDIHGGGIDLVFPHHENEIAQSEGAHHEHPLANVWMHNGFLNVEGEKMSKSLGNFVTINELLTTNVFGGRNWSGEVLRLNMLRTHYRQPIDWTITGLEEAETILRRFCGKVKQFEFVRRGLQEKPRDPDLKAPGEIIEALCDDLNTPLMFSRMHELNTDSAVEQSLLLLGIDVRSYARWLRARDETANSSEIETLIAARLAARKAKDFKESDRIRDELLAQGIVLKDGPQGTTWEVKK